MSPKKITAEFQFLFHPEIPIRPIEVSLIFSFNQGKNWETYLVNKATDLNWAISIYDVPIGETLEFFVRLVLDDGRLMLVKKNNKNYKVAIRDNTNQSRYKAQVRITEDLLSPVGRKCLICEQIIRKGSNMCDTPGCNAVFCPKCNRMLPPFSNYCPWDKITF